MKANQLNLCLRVTASLLSLVYIVVSQGWVLASIFHSIFLGNPVILFASTEEKNRFK